MEPPGVQTIPPPAAIEESSAPTIPWMWKRGITPRQRSAAVSPRAFAILEADTHILAWVNGTALDLAVVPDVCRSTAMSSAFDNPLFIEFRPTRPERSNR